MESRDKVLP